MKICGFGFVKAIAVLTVTAFLNVTVSSEALSNWIGASGTANVKKVASGTNQTFGTTGGGEFFVTNANNASDPGFFTFCLEKNQTFNPNNPVNYNITADSSTQGSTFNGVIPGSGDVLFGGGTNSITLNILTKALYYEYLLVRNGVKTNLFNSALGYTPSNADADAVQNAIWYLHGNQVNAASNAYVQATIAAYVGGYFTAPRLFLYNQVLVMNSFQGANNTPSQDFIAFTGTSLITTIPEPAAFSLFACGLVGFCGYFRRRSAV